MEQEITELVQQQTAPGTEELVLPAAAPGAEELARQFELAKLDYAALGTQEQSLIDKRPAIWPIFFGILIIPCGYAGIVTLRGAVYLLALVPFFITCISLDIKHDEKVLRYDVRKARKLLAERWGFKNHDSQYSDQDGSRWWHGYYRLGKAVALVGAQLIVSAIVSWYFCTTGLLPLGVALAALNLFFALFTTWCML